ncbi:MAG: helix-turn-helix domain-containing protein [Dehalococcoidia bacterium]
MLSLGKWSTGLKGSPTLDSTAVVKGRDNDPSKVPEVAANGFTADQQKEREPARARHDTRLLTVGEVSRMLHVHANSVRRWTDEGLLPAYRIGRRGDRRFSEEAVENFLGELITPPRLG